MATLQAAPGSRGFGSRAGQVRRWGLTLFLAPRQGTAGEGRQSPRSLQTPAPGSLLGSVPGPAQARDRNWWCCPPGAAGRGARGVVRAGILAGLQEPP